jgi:polysaccharide export outer membrane protein
MPGRISLIDALALAQGLSQVAKCGEVAVIRRVGGQRVGGPFDLGRIRAGMDPDPEVVAGDQIIVGTSAIKSAYRDLLLASPLIGAFRPF